MNGLDVRQRLQPQLQPPQPRLMLDAPNDGPMIDGQDVADDEHEVCSKSNYYSTDDERAKMILPLGW